MSRTVVRHSGSWARTAESMARVRQSLPSPKTVMPSRVRVD
ncbi:hypothetical protein [Streptomyces uncialis]